MKSKFFKMFSVVLAISTVITLTSCTMNDKNTMDNNGDTTSSQTNTDGITGNGTNTQGKITKMGEDMKDATKKGINDIKDTTKSITDTMDGKNNN